MGKEATGRLVERAYQVCQCGECLTCKMAGRLLGQVEEINNQLRSKGSYVHMVVWRAQIISAAIKHLKADHPVAALSTLQDRVADGDALLTELAHATDEERDYWRLNHGDVS